MSHLPQVSGREVVVALKKAGYAKDRQLGSHIVLRQEKHPHRRLVIPDHKELSKGTLRGVVQQSGLTSQEFMDLLG